MQPDTHDEAPALDESDDSRDDPADTDCAGCFDDEPDFVLERVRRLLDEAGGMV